MLIISSTGNADVKVPLTLQVTGGGGITVMYNGAAIPASGISLFVGVNGFVSQTLTLSSNTPTTFTASSNQTWLTLNPTSGTFTGSTTVTMSVNAAGLPTGANQAIVRIVGSGGVTTSITVTANVGTGGGLTLSPNPMNFTYITSTGAYSPGQTQNLSVSGASSSAGFTVTASSSPQWLLVNGTASTTFGAGTTQIPISVNAAVLNLTTPTTYTGTVLIQPTDGTASATLTVNLTISATGPTSPNTLTFNVAAPGGAAPAPQQITISGSGAFNVVTATNNCGQGWLAVSPNSGVLSPTGTTLTVQVFPGSISSQTCTGTISIGGLLTSGTSVFNVSMVIGGSGVVGGGQVASPSALTFNIPSGGTQSQTFIVNGDGTSFSAQAIGTNLTVFPTAGSTPAVVTVSAGSTSSSGTIIVSSSFGTQNVGVTVNVLSGNVLTANPSSLSFVYTPGNNLQTQTVAIGSSGDATGNNLTYSAVSAPAFVSVVATSSVTPSSLGVGFNAGQLGPGFNTGNIVLSASGTGAANTSLTIPVTVLAPGSTPGFTASPTSVTLSAQQFGAPVSHTVSIGGLNNVNFTATPISSGNWLTVSPGSGTSPATLTITATPLNLNAQTVPYQGTVTVPPNTGPALTIPVSLTVSTTSPSTPVLSVSPSSLTFNYRTGDPAPAAQNIQVGTTGGSTTYTATPSASWITVSPTSASTPGVVSVSVNTALLTQPTQTGTVTISASGAQGSPQIVSVTANVTTPPMLTVSVGNSTTFTYRTGDPTPPNHTVQ